MERQNPDFEEPCEQSHLQNAKRDTSITSREDQLQLTDSKTQFELASASPCCISSKLSRH